ncbi:MAG: hypothetical protein U5J95_11645 [Balneolaceae bacterium]|nr:hypothetical protein [Balneolaceae bacterium]
MGKIFLWILGGALLATGAFFIPEQSGSMWPSLFLSSSAVLIYLAAFCFVWLKKIQSATKRKAIGWTLGILVVFSGISAAISYESSQRQKETLVTIRSTIETGIIQNYVNEPLLKTLRAHAQGSGDSNDFGKLFRAEYDSLITEEGMLAYDKDRDDNTVFVYMAKASADSLVLIGESAYLKGESSDFKNHSGETGRYQVKGILTSGGIDYERAN